MANQSLNAPEGTGPVDRTRIHLHLDTAGAFVHQGPKIPSSLRDRVLCNGTLRPVWETDGHPVNVGRDMRVVPERTRKVVEHRDQCCRFPGCTRKRHLDVHHIIHWLYDGETDTWNLVVLCPHHHRAHHRGGFGLTGNADIADHLEHPDGLRFTRPDGTIIRACERPVVPARPAPPAVSKFIHPTGERFDATLLSYRNAAGTFDPPRARRDRASSEPPDPVGRIRVVRSVEDLGHRPPSRTSDTERDSDSEPDSSLTT